LKSNDLLLQQWHIITLEWKLS